MGTCIYPKLKPSARALIAHFRHTSPYSSTFNTSLQHDLRTTDAMKHETMDTANLDTAESRASLMPLWTGIMACAEAIRPTNFPATCSFSISKPQLKNPEQSTYIQKLIVDQGHRATPLRTATLTAHFKQTLAPIPPTMRFQAILVTLTTLLATSLAGNSNVKNNCPYDVSLWSVDSNGPGSETRLARNGGWWSQPYRSVNNQGIAIKITRDVNGIYEAGEPQLIESYALSGGAVWYDLNVVMGDPGIPVTVKPSAYQGGNCHDAYVRQGNGNCNSGVDLTMYLCSW